MLFSLPLPPPLHPVRLAVRLLNAMLAREPWARERLARHAGKTVRFVLARLDVSLTVLSDGLTEWAAADAEPTVVLTVPAEHLSLDRLWSGSDLADAFTDMTHISGDAAFAQVVAELARHLRPDWQDALAERVGDVAAVRIMQGAQALRDGVLRGGERFAQNVAEYLSEETATLLGRPVFADFCHALADEHAALVILEQRVVRLNQRLDSRASQAGADKLP